MATPIASTDKPAPEKPLRLWPGVVAAALLCLFRFGLPLVLPESIVFGILSAFVLTLVIVVWWAFFSRAPRMERWGALALIVVALFATSLVVDKSIRNGMMGLLLVIYAPPVASLALVAWAALTRRMAARPRRAWMVASILFACGMWSLVRTEGITGGAGSAFRWRWTQTPEERLLAQVGKKLVAHRPAETVAKAPIVPSPVPPTNDKAVPPPAPMASKPAPERPATQAQSEPAPAPIAPAGAKAPSDWPGFRGPNRDSIVRGARIATGWTESPPVELWRRPIGPGWSSFAVQGDLLYTQEQRGEDEVVSCYSMATGEPVWQHSDPTRFWESNAGAGPRATPTLADGRVYAFGATGLLNALRAVDGTVIWSRNVASDANAKVPGWGFSSSPLVVGDVVIVAAAGQLVGYDLATGNPRWFGPKNGSGYSSPHLSTIGGVPQVLLMSVNGTLSVAPSDGQTLWEHRLTAGARIVQPALTPDGDVLTSDGESGNMRRLAVTKGSGGSAGWTLEERWTSNGLKPYFNDFVVHNGHAFGFDGRMLACIDLQDGKRKWKGGRYGNGQLVLLADQDVLLVISEQGELALAAATPDQFKEFARFPAIKGKTWNHPVLVGDVLLVRNDQEMAAFRLSLANQTKVALKD